MDQHAGTSNNRRDFRTLSSTELQSLLVQLGTSGDKIVSMSRSNRVRVLQFEAMEAKRSDFAEDTWQCFQHGDHTDIEVVATPLHIITPKAYKN